MAPRLHVAIAVGAVACATLSGCGDGPHAPVDATPSQYVAAAQALLDPPAQLASLVSERSADPAAAIPPHRQLEDIVERARARLAAFRALRLRDRRLRAQRDRLATSYEGLTALMPATVDALADHDRGALAAAASPFLAALRGLSSVTASPSS
jgi:hypothetical protein